MFEHITITDEEFNLISNLVYKKAGIKLSETKQALVTTRLQKNLRHLGFRKFKDYYKYVIDDPSGNALSDLVNAISTNHTYFYREEKHFDFFYNEVLPSLSQYLEENNSHDIRIWSAGCSTGDEAFMLVMLLLEYFGNNYLMWDAGVLATDISKRVLDLAKSGVYSSSQLEKLPVVYIRKYFRKLKHENKWQIIENVKKEVTFRRLNLINNDFPFRKPFHVIFCRNVMIYFDEVTRNRLINNFYRYMLPGSYLFIGHSETLGREQKLFKYIQPAIYRRI